MRPRSAKILNFCDAAEATEEVQQERWWLQICGNPWANLNCTELLGMELVSHLNPDGTKRDPPKRDSKQKFFHSSWYCNNLDRYIMRLMKGGDGRFQKWRASRPLRSFHSISQNPLPDRTDPLIGF